MNHELLRESKCRSASGKSIWLLVVGTILAANCLVAALLRPGNPKLKLPDPRVLPPEAVDQSIVYSNILPEDYVGPDLCSDCHQKQYELWTQHPHSRMNQLPHPDSVMGDFDNAELVLPTGCITFTQDSNEDYWMTVYRDQGVHRRYKVTRTVGSRYMQAYIGVQTEGPEPAGHAIYKDHHLPFAYWFKLKRWIPREYQNIFGPEVLRDGIPQDEVLDRQPDVIGFGEACMNCHNTYPYAYRIFHKNLTGFSAAQIATTIGPLSEALKSTVNVEPNVKSFVGLNGRLDPEQHLVSTGISCESCHLGGREHAESQRQIRFLPTSKFIKLTPKQADRVLTNSRENSLTMLGTCVQCHSGNSEMFPNGAAKSNSREALDMQAGFCTSKLSCIDCHEPHTGTRSEFVGIDRPRHVEICATCHTQYQDRDAAMAHGGHPASADVNCLDCHMQKINAGNK